MKLYENKLKKKIETKEYFQMALVLHEHQNMALPILRKMERKGKGGFLSDECGLGKTISMATHLMENKIIFQAALVV